MQVTQPGGLVPMQVAPPDGQILNQCKWCDPIFNWWKWCPGGQVCIWCKYRHHVAKFVINASGAIGWPNLQPIKVLPLKSTSCCRFIQVMVDGLNSIESIPLECFPAFLILSHFRFWKGIFTVASWIRLEIMVPKHPWKCKTGPLQPISATKRYASFFGSPWR